MVVDSLADAFVADIGGMVCAAADDGKFDIDSTAWRTLLAEHRDKDVPVQLYAHREQGWVRHPAFALHVAAEDIDSYLNYRLIEPGYEIYQQLGIYQRNLTNFEVTTIYENHRDIDLGKTHCINCHTFQNYDTERMYLHVRENHSGTIFTHGTETKKIIIRHDSILASGAYGNWHPQLPLVAFSTNKTAQVFHYSYKEKIEVYDYSSDLLLYDPDHNEVRHILHTPDDYETFPCWSADGTRLFYCKARPPRKHTDKDYEFQIVMHFDSLLYDIYSMPFDTVNYTFGEPRLEVSLSPQHLSCSMPRVSPDGRYLLFSVAQYGQFHIYHKSANLWVKPLRPSPSGEDSSSYRGENNPAAAAPADEVSTELYPLTAANSPDAESFPGWSSNGRWIVFSSRRDDSSYTRSYIAYFDVQGKAHRAFLLPQRDPEYNQLLLKSYNVPQLTRSAVPFTQKQMNKAIRSTEAELATYKGLSK